MFVILSILLTLLILSILVLVHELGHFMAARSIGCPVESFSIGMGPVVKRWKWARYGDTEFRLSAIPFGGYVTVTGEEGAESDNPNNFYSKTPWQRIWFAGAGVLMNFILALVIFVVGSLAFGDIGVPYNQVGMLQPGAARKAGIQQNEWILYVNGVATPAWEDVPVEVRKYPNQKITLTLGDDTGEAIVNVTPKTWAGIFGYSYIDWPKIPWPTSDKVMDNTFLNIDNVLYHLSTIKKVGDKAVTNWDETVKALQAISGPTDITFGKAVKLREVDLTPGVTHDEQGKEIGVIGVQPSGSTVHLPFLQALWFGIQKFWFYIVAIVGAIISLFGGNFQNVGGAIAIGDMIGQSANLGITWLFTMMGNLSVALAVFNLIPFPGLDGSRIFFSLIEGITKKRLPRTVENVIHFIGFVILMILLVALVGRDLFLRLFK